MKLLFPRLGVDRRCGYERCLLDLFGVGDDEMSAILEQAFMSTYPDRAADCARNDLALATFTRADPHRVLQPARYARSTSEAFKGPEYGAAIEIYRLPLLTRFFRLFGVTR